MKGIFMIRSPLWKLRALNKVNIIKTLFPPRPQKYLKVFSGTAGAYFFHFLSFFGLFLYFQGLNAFFQKMANKDRLRNRGQRAEKRIQTSKPIKSIGIQIKKVGFISNNQRYNSVTLFYTFLGPKILNIDKKTGKITRKGCKQCLKQEKFG